MDNKQLVKTKHPGDEADTLGVVIRRLRERRGLSQAALARCVGVDQQAISQIEAAPPGSQPRLAHLCLIADTLDVSPYELLASSRDSVEPAQRANLLLRLGDFLAIRVEHQLATGHGGIVGRARRRLIYAEERRRRGFPCEAAEEACDVASVLRPHLQTVGDDVEVAATLFSAHDLFIRSSMEIHTRQALSDVRAACSHMDALIAETSLGQQRDAQAKALLRRADLCMLSGDRQLHTGWEAVERGLSLAAMPSLRLDLLRVKAGLAKRLGLMKDVTSAARMIDRAVDGGDVDAATVSFVYQGLSGNLAAISRHGRRDGMRKVKEARLAYDESVKNGTGDSHIESLILRSEAMLAATTGYGSDLELAASAAQRGLELAQAANRTRTLRHCQIVLDAARNHRLLDAFPP
ncbi:MAG TPA: helix-turn-helix transcriptional regulator [Chloroflexota bacterium]|nr:helix-turn-helix transcriptional regulator [Chloroflexota bacterium]